MAVEEGAVDSGAASDAGDAEFCAVFDGGVEGGKDALAASRGVGSTSFDIASTAGVMLVVMGFAPGAGRVGVGGCEACRASRCGGGARR
jgi:hypothetical protein